MRKIELKTFPDLGLAMAFRNFLEVLWQGLLPEEKKKNLILAFDEVFTNAVKYGSGPSSVVWVEFKIEKKKLSFMVSDEGGGKKIKTSDLMKNIKNRKNNLLDTSGRGMSVLIPNLCSGFQVTDNKFGGISVEAWKNV